MLDLKAKIEDYEEYVKKKGLKAENFIGRCQIRSLDALL